MVWIRSFDTYEYGLNSCTPELITTAFSRPGSHVRCTLRRTMMNCVSIAKLSIVTTKLFVFSSFNTSFFIYIRTEVSESSPRKNNNEHGHT